jgi:hypothetical protein
MDFGTAVRLDHSNLGAIVTPANLEFVRRSNCLGIARGGVKVGV